MMQSIKKGKHEKNNKKKNERKVKKFNDSIDLWQFAFGFNLQMFRISLGSSLRYNIVRTNADPYVNEITS